jgi:hypothetical protein
MIFMWVMNDLNFLWILYCVCDGLYVIVMDYMILCMKI